MELRGRSSEGEGFQGKRKVRMGGEGRQVVEGKEKGRV